MSLGILGGTFNPIHRAHVRLGEAARRALDLERVLLVPAADPPLKRAGIAPARHRLAMVRLAVAGRPGFGVLDLEMQRSGPSYTIHTLQTLAERFAGQQLWFICGADALAELDAWRQPERLFEHAGFAVAQRPGSACDLAELLPPSLAGAFRRDERGWVHRSGGRLESVPFEPMDVSATQIRERVARGEPIDDLVDEAVARYIDEHQLYREAV